LSGHGNQNHFRRYSVLRSVIPHSISGCVAEGIRTGESPKKHETRCDQLAEEIAGSGAEIGAI